MTRYSDPVFKVVITPAEDILTTSGGSSITNDEGPFNGETVPTINF